VKDDLDETLEAITAHINAGVAKVKAAQRADLERLGRPGQATGKSFVEFEDSVAVMRRDAPRAEEAPGSDRHARRLERGRSANKGSPSHVLCDSVADAR
jgi:hypothetical protein